MNNRPLSVAHLVFGLIFLGVAGLWAVGESTGADAGDIAQMAPAVLIGAGLIGLAASVVNARIGRRSGTPEAPSTLEPAVEEPPVGEPAVHEPTTDDNEYADTAVLDQEEQK